MDPDLVAQRRVGTTLHGKWQLEKLLGVGGMAAVYVGVHTIGRRDAIKILHPDVARSPELRARFEREAHAVNRLKHPGAVEIRDIDIAEDGAPFLVMELLEGESLADHAARVASVEAGDLLRWTDELLDVLVAAHAQGIIHRDIKLDNLFLLSDGRLKVLDFGIAHVKAGMNDEARTRTGAALGTVPYMAPEQIKGEAIDARVDLFAVGATMFRLVARRRVHEADTEPMLMIKMATEPAPALASVAPGAPPGLCLVVDRALQFQREQRYPDALTMQLDVRALRAGQGPPYATGLAGSGGVAPRDERTAAAAPMAFQAAAFEPTLHAPAPAPAAAAPGVQASRAARESEEKRVLVIAIAALAVLLLLGLVLMLVRPSSGSAETDPTAAGTSDAPDMPSTGDPDDPSWRPSPPRGPGAQPAGGHPPKKKKKHGHGHGKGRGDEDD